MKTSKCNATVTAARDADGVARETSKCILPLGHADEWHTDESGNQRSRQFEMMTNDQIFHLTPRQFASLIRKA